LQRSKKARSRVVAARAALAALDDYDMGLDAWAIIFRVKTKETIEQARAALDVVIANINITVPRVGNKNAVQNHNQYWGLLASYYEIVQPGHSPKQLIAFVHACSRPVFPRETTLQAVSSFAYRFCKRPRI
jgi:hypothetical protein